MQENVASADAKLVREGMFLPIKVRVAPWKAEGEGSVANFISSNEVKGQEPAAGACAFPRDWQNSVAPLFTYLVALSAMQKGLAPLPISREIKQALARRANTCSYKELEFFAHRYYFLQDARIFLAELKSFRPLDADSHDLEEPSKSSSSITISNPSAEV